MFSAGQYRPTEKCNIDFFRKYYLLKFKFDPCKKRDILFKMTYRNIHIQVYILNFVVGEQILWGGGE